MNQDTTPRSKIAVLTMNVAPTMNLTLTMDVVLTVSAVLATNVVRTMNVVLTVSLTLAMGRGPNNESDKGCGPNSEQKELRKQCI